MNDLLFSRIAWMNDIVLLHWMYISARDKKSFLYYAMINEIPLVFRTGTALYDTRLGLIQSRDTAFKRRNLRNQFFSRMIKKARTIGYCLSSSCIIISNIEYYE